MASRGVVAVNPDMRRLFFTLLLVGLFVPAARAGAPTVLFVIGEHEYGTKETLPAFAKAELGPRGVTSLFVVAKSDDRASKDCHLFPGLQDKLKKADVLFLSVRRRYPLPADMAAIKKWIADGKPVVGIRTSSHPFGERPKGKGYQAPAGHVAWNSFDQDVLGIEYTGHYGSKSGHRVHPYYPRGATRQAIMKGVVMSEGETIPSHLYISNVKHKKVNVLLRAKIEEENADEPIAWTLERSGQRTFYTSVGGVEDMRLGWFRQLLVNAVFWSVDQSVPGKGAQTSAVGNWKLRLTDPEGGVHHPWLRLETKRGKLSAVYTAASDEKEYQPAGLKVSASGLSFTVASETWTVKYALTIEGNKLAGKMEYDIAGYQGTTDVTGVRQLEGAEE